MSGAYDNRPVYPDEQSTIEKFEQCYEQYRSRIRSYISLKTNAAAADDLTQQVFLKAIENLHSFKENASFFTWIFKIAENTVKNEYRSLARKKEMPYDFTSYESQSVSLDFAKYVEIRIDIGSALNKLKELDQQIISLRFFLDCTLSEIANIVGMRESAVKNRLYRSLEKLRTELKEWGDIAVMSILDMISIVNKNEAAGSKDPFEKVHQDLFRTLKENVERIASKYKHRPSCKTIIEIYPDLPTFHQAVGEADAPNWFMGTYEGNRLKIVSPLNPGPEHTYESIIKSTLHLYTMWLIEDINATAPKWVRQGIGGYEAKQMTEEFIANTTADAVRRGEIPEFLEFNNDTWDFETMKGFQYSYLIVEFITESYGLDTLNQVIRNPHEFNGIFKRSESELREQWISYMKTKFNI
ncbi:RNA polymerase sigma factor [Paenibacillus radicis (ex Gao et al. 2016)]|uniref:RNA polymerase sigma factor n=1 Tax=Paenibacillus radicis (ex Gao et al. 2016) TaxID=1737354 RepID=A0A917LW87_9BACL|nr:sigma-70 family RNA polymerase sigma factor [Paenibacillus radicis (ex Gao et al. 2016)]GGG60764.1 hypothetical protein GCM10010918_12630 [Paenibacillus radicis (ex Gao et al. 2016)]